MTNILEGIGVGLLLCLITLSMIFIIYAVIRYIYEMFRDLSERENTEMTRNEDSLSYTDSIS